MVGLGLDFRAGEGGKGLKERVRSWGVKHEEEGVGGRARER
jgi:hypothetical protein